MSGECFGAVIGYSIFDTEEECYAYNENACFIAGSRESANVFLDVCDVDFRAARIDAFAWDDLLRDYGCSGREYAMEAAAFARFEKLARQYDVAFDADGYDGDESRR